MFALVALGVWLALAASVSAGTLLDYEQCYQEKDQWCWAGTSQSILRYYGDSLSQSNIALYGTEGSNVWNWTWGHSDASPPDPARNGVDMILDNFGAIQVLQIASTVPSNTILADLNQGCGMVIRWAWDAGGGHILAGRGLVGDAMYLMDPWYGPTITTYGWVCVGGGHTWTHSLRLTTIPNHLEIHHTPTADTTNTIGPPVVEAEITPVSLVDLVKTAILWNTNGSSFYSTSSLALVTNCLYRGVIPAQPSRSVVYYYIHAEGTNGATLDTSRYQFAVPPAVTYVATNGAHASPFDTWNSAATNIQAAVDAVGTGGSVWLSNGLYRISAEIGIGRQVTVRSVNGPGATIVARAAPGSNAPQHRIFGLYAALAGVEGLTITNGYAGNGGGVYSAQGGGVRNCIITGNAAVTNGGGVCADALRTNDVLANCLITGNSGGAQGGGVFGGALYNCTIAGNSAGSGGGASSSLNYNCIIYLNAASNSLTNVASPRDTSYCCVAPKGTGDGSIEQDPLFVDAAHGDFHERSAAPSGAFVAAIAAWTNFPGQNSPCIDTGDPGSPYSIEPPWNGGFVNMGAYGNSPEASRSVDADGDGLSDTFETYRFGTSPTNADMDNDGFGDGSEYWAGTNPTNSLSLLRMTRLDSTPGTGFVVRWASVTGKWYRVERATNTPDSFLLIQAGIPAAAPENVYTNAQTNIPRAFFRVGVEP